MSRSFINEICDEMFKLLDACCIYLTAYKTNHDLPMTREDAGRLQKKVVDAMQGYIEYNQMLVAETYKEIDKIIEDKFK